MKQNAGPVRLKSGENLIDDEQRVVLPREPTDLAIELRRSR